MKNTSRIYVLALILIGSLQLSAKLPGTLYLNAAGGIQFPGIMSKGSGYAGKYFELSGTYIVFPEKHFGFQVTAGFAQQRFKHHFTETIFAEQIQTGLALAPSASMQIGERGRLLVGFDVFVPGREHVDIGERRFNQTFYFSNDSVMSKYDVNPVQAAVVVAMDYSIGKQKQVLIGFRLRQAANSPVSVDAVYYDGLGHTLTMSSEMRPASVQFYVACRLGKFRKVKNRESE